MPARIPATTPLMTASIPGVVTNYMGEAARTGCRAVRGHDAWLIVVLTRR